jgi:DNA invertase Pin-like site-specific DNA recombinase
VLYARLSVTKEESVSIARQLDATRKYAEGRGWIVAGEFVDDGVSATANRPEDRKGWRALLAAGEFDAVVIWKVDRLARRVLDFLHVDEVLQKRGAGLVAVEDPIDMTTPMGRAFATILAVFGEMEAAAIASRVKAARAHLIKQGRFVGGGVPYGYVPADNPDGPGRILAKDPDRIDWLEGIVRRARQGSQTGAIVRWLNQSGAPLPRLTRERRDDEEWNRQTVEGILRNPILAGMTPYNPGRKSGKAADPFAVVRDENDAPIVDSSLAILTVDEFAELVQAMDDRPTTQARKYPGRQHTSPLLSRVAHCADCDRWMCRGTNQGKAVLYCPKCRQTIGRAGLDEHLEQRLLTERGDMAYGGKTVREYWQFASTSETEKRAVLVSQLDGLHIRRGVVGRFDADRVLLAWRACAMVARDA